MNAGARDKLAPRRRALVEREVAELARDCRRVLVLLERREKYRAAGRDCETILGELGAIVLHLHHHTKGLDEMIDDLSGETDGKSRRPTTLRARR
mgnify:FL=1